jgi:hypothetical protein
VFIHFPYHISNLRQLVLILNTALIIAALVVFELRRSDGKRIPLRNVAYLMPASTVLGGLLVFAVYLQGKGF